MCSQRISVQLTPQVCIQTTRAHSTLSFCWCSWYLSHLVCRSWWVRSLVRVNVGCVYLQLGPGHFCYICTACVSLYIFVFFQLQLVLWLRGLGLILVTNYTLIYPVILFSPENTQHQSPASTYFLGLTDLICQTQKNVYSLIYLCPWSSFWNSIT